MYVPPVLLGDGIRFYTSRVARIDLEPLDSTRHGAVTILRFRVRKQSSCSYGSFRSLPWRLVGVGMPSLVGLLGPVLVAASP